MNQKGRGKRTNGGKELLFFDDKMRKLEKIGAFVFFFLLGVALVIGDSTLTDEGLVTDGNVTASHYCNSTECHVIQDFLASGIGDNPFDQDLNTTDTPWFTRLGVGGAADTNTSRPLMIYNNGNVEIIFNDTKTTPSQHIAGNFLWDGHPTTHRWKFFVGGVHEYPAFFIQEQNVTGINDLLFLGYPNSGDADFVVESYKARNMVIQTRESLGTGDIILAPNEGNMMFFDESESSVGVSCSTPLTGSGMDVYGGLSVGGHYACSSAAPQDGAIIEGDVGIGTTSPSNKLEVVGEINASGLIYGSRMLLPYGKYTATTADAFMRTAGFSLTGTDLGYAMMRSGDIIGLSVAFDCTVVNTQGDIVWIINHWNQSNGDMFVYNITTTVTSTGYKSKTGTQAVNIDPFTAGDMISVKADFTTFAGSIRHINSLVEVTFEN